MGDVPDHDESDLGVELRGYWRDFVTSELTHHLADLKVLLSEVEGVVHVGIVRAWSVRAFGKLRRSAIIARFATITNSLLAEISEHEGAATNRRARVSLHGIQLLEIRGAPPRDCVPIDVERIE